MSKRKNSHRVLAIAGLLGLAATAFSAQDASAFGHAGFGGHFGGHGGGFGGGLHAGGDRGFGGGHMPGLGRMPGRLPPIVRLPPNHIHPIINRPPRHIPPVIVRFPPRFPPPVIVRLPPRILPPPVIIGQAPPVILGGRSMAMAQNIRPVAAVQGPMQGPAGCGIDGSFVAITFVPTVTAADITAFLKAYNVTMADGPNTDGLYRIRLSTAAMPRNEVLKVIDSMRSQTAIVGSIDGA